MNRSLHPLRFLLLALTATLAAACVAPPLVVPAPSGMEAESRAVDATSDMITSPAIIDSVTLEQRGGEYVAVVGGSLPDSCTEVGDSTQEVNGNTIEITLMTVRPADAMCATMISPFSTEITIDVSGLEPGEYTVVVNGVTAGETISV